MEILKRAIWFSAKTAKKRNVEQRQIKPRGRGESMNCLHIEIARHPYLKTGWDLRIGDVRGCIGITTQEESKQEILDEISRAMDRLEGQGTHEWGDLAIREKKE